MPGTHSPTIDQAGGLSPLRIEVLIMLPLSVTTEVVRELVTTLQAARAAVGPFLHETIGLLPRMIIALEQIAAISPAIEELAATRPAIERLAESTPTLAALAEATASLEQLAETGLILQRLGETSGQIEKLANATVVAPIQGTAERFGRIVAGLPGNPLRAQQKPVATAELTEGGEIKATNGAKKSANGK
jgi:hypothetical protein